MEEQLEQTGGQKEQPSIHDHLTMWRCRRGMIMRIIEYGMVKSDKATNRLSHHFRKLPELEN